MIYTTLQVTRSDIYLLRRAVELMRDRLANAKRDPGLDETEVALAAVCDHATELATRLWDADSALEAGQKQEREAVSSDRPY